jgi:uncharacterized OB-fold protein
MKKARGLYDEKMWAGFAERQLLLQRCDACGTHRYPPAAACAKCLAPGHTWTPASGRAEIVSWAVFHRQYLPAYPAPYNVIAVQLAEGPLMVSNLEGSTPEGTWIGRAVALAWSDMAEGPLPRFRLA